MAAFSAPCKHCGETMTVEPRERIILYVGDNAMSNWFNARCDKCDGVRHFNAKNTNNFGQILAWLMIPCNFPQVAPADHADMEIAEILEGENISQAPISYDDILDFMLALESNTVDLRKVEAFEVELELSDNAGSSSATNCS